MNVHKYLKSQKYVFILNWFNIVTKIGSGFDGIRFRIVCGFGGKSYRSVSNSSEVSLEPPSTFNVKMAFHLRYCNYRV